MEEHELQEKVVGEVSVEDTDATQDVSGNDLDYMQEAFRALDEVLQSDVEGTRATQAEHASNLNFLRETLRNLGPEDIRVVDHEEPEEVADEPDPVEYVDSVAVDDAFPVLAPGEPVSRGEGVTVNLVRSYLTRTGLDTYSPPLPGICRALMGRLPSIVVPYYYVAWHMTRDDLHDVGMDMTIDNVTVTCTDAGLSVGMPITPDTACIRSKFIARNDASPNAVLHQIIKSLMRLKTLFGRNFGIKYELVRTQRSGSFLYIMLLPRGNMMFDIEPLNITWGGESVG